MKNLLFLFVFLVNSYFAADLGAKKELPNFEVLQDHHFSIHQIIKDKDHLFQKTDKLYPSKNLNWWVKLKILKTEFKDDKYYFFAHPGIDNTMYYFNEDSSKIVHSSSGFLISNGNRHKGIVFDMNQNSDLKTVARQFSY